VTRSVEIVRVAELESRKDNALQAYASQLASPVGGSTSSTIPPALVTTEVALPAQLVGRAVKGPELFFTVKLR
jgi:hypothetical protein